MVFCGKASLSCKNCRIRRIKCNKLEPECSQCIRAGKKCPGYRDQLSLMFRDETVKVRKKFEESNTDGFAVTAGSSTGTSPPTSAPTETTAAFVADKSVSPPSAASVTEDGGSAGQFSSFQTTQNRVHGPTPGTVSDQGRNELAPIKGSGAGGSFTLSEALAAFGGTYGNNDGMGTSSSGNPLSVARKQQRKRQGGARTHVPDVTVPTEGTVDLSIEAQTILVHAMLRGPGRTLFEQGLQFYMDHYLYGHPESPTKTGVIAVDTPWILDPAARTIASAVGMAGMANLRGDDEIQMSAWQNYVTGLQMTAKTLTTPGLDTINNVMRSIILMAMFELISCHAAHMTVPPVMAEYISSTYREKPKDDQIMSQLLLTLIDFINLSTYIHHQVLIDGRPDMVDHIMQALQLEARLISWELGVTEKGLWKYDVCETTKLPPEACYKGRFHRYSDISTARIWGYYRWGRILLNEMFLEFIEKCPHSVAASLARLKMDNVKSSGMAIFETSGADTRDTDAEATEKLRRKALKVIRKCAEDTFVSTPVYWRHPSISLEDYATVATPAPVYGANGGTGVAGLMPTLFHLHVAACAPGVPEEDWNWVLAMIDTVWAFLGLRQARTLADKMRAHREALKRQEMGLNGVLLLTADGTMDVAA
ncbi:hypothetical protein SEUCBS140593_000698 [Sporothrix eucalyptigena]|uniref:Zn(2)-C6 fungal-type domain-containing protein n=1 Tax=Sporothrix eucalyptigena TaxID=1812306 RepID=A0ABP0AS30_9PEZI